MLAAAGFSDPHEGGREFERFFNYLPGNLVRQNNCVRHMWEEFSASGYT